jgi:hypothetical protein
MARPSKTRQKKTLEHAKRPQAPGFRMNELKEIRRYVWLLAFVILGIAGAGPALAAMKWLGAIAAFAEIWRQTHS